MIASPNHHLVLSGGRAVLAGRALTVVSCTIWLPILRGAIFWKDWSGMGFICTSLEGLVDRAARLGIEQRWTRTPESNECK